MNSINKEYEKPKENLGFFFKIGPYFFFCFLVVQEVERWHFVVNNGTTYTVRYLFA